MVVSISPINIIQICINCLWNSLEQDLEARCQIFCWLKDAAEWSAANQHPKSEIKKEELMFQCTNTLVPKIGLPRYVDVSRLLSGLSPNSVIEFRYLLCFSHLSSTLVIYLYSFHPSWYAWILKQILLSLTLEEGKSIWLNTMKQKTQIRSKTGTLPR